MLLMSMLAACGTASVSTNITRNPSYAHARALYLSPTASQYDSYVTVPDELPVTFQAPTPGRPGAAAFQREVIGDWTVYVSQNGATLASSKQTTTAGQLLTALIGPAAVGGTAPVATQWVLESFPAKDGKARARFVLGAADWQGSSIQLGAVTLISQAALGPPTAWQEVPLGKSDVVITPATGAPVTVPGVDLSAGRLLTIVLSDGASPSEPLLLNTFDDEALAALTAADKLDAGSAP
jgi:hypothetical protein